MVVAVDLQKSLLVWDQLWYGCSSFVHGLANRTSLHQTNHKQERSVLFNHISGVEPLPYAIMVNIICTIRK